MVMKQDLVVSGRSPIRILRVATFYLLEKNVYGKAYVSDLVQNT